MQRHRFSEYGKTEVDGRHSHLSCLRMYLRKDHLLDEPYRLYFARSTEGFKITAHTPDCPVAAMENAEKKLYAIQFHPEVLHTVGRHTRCCHNFVYSVCGCAGDWKMDAFVEKSIEAIREKVGNGKVLCALSGGVDSSVAARSAGKGNRRPADLRIRRSRSAA